MSFSGRRQIVLMIVGLAALTISAWSWHNRAASDYRTNRQSWDAVLQCVSCGHRFETEMKLSYPLSGAACPKCRKPTAWPVKRCSKCDFAFVPEVSSEPPQPPPVPRCPKCGDDRYVSALLPAASKKP